MAIGVKRYNGSSWVNGAVKKYNGSSWVDAYTYRWNGSKWVQIYPETAVTQSFGWEGNNDYRSWREGGYENTSGQKSAKQGPYGSYGAAYGYLDILSSSIPGTKNIESIDYVDVKTTRMGAGEYNADKTIYFWRSADKPDSVPTLLGSSWTAPAPGVGSGVGFDTDMSINSHTLNWANQVGSGKYLWIYTSSASQYLSLGVQFKLEMGYTYAATSAAFIDAETPATILTAEDDYNSAKNTSYHVMTIYDDEVDLSLTEIMKRREDGIVEDIKTSCVDRMHMPKPWSREYKVTEDRDGNQIALIEVFGLRTDDEVQMSLDKINWITMKQLQSKYGFYEGVLPQDFNKMYDWIYIRCIDTKADKLHFETEIEPIIIL